MNENKRELNPDEMEQISGGAGTPINPGTQIGAIRPGGDPIKNRQQPPVPGVQYKGLDGKGK